MSAAESTARTAFIAELFDEWSLFPGLEQLPDPTPAEGPDPYGNDDPDWLRIDWREHLRTIEVPVPVSGSKLPTKVNYVETGSGPATLLFVHGLSGCWQNWLENIPHFARRYRVVAPDLPGFGTSPMPPWDISISAYGRLLHAFAKALGIGDCIVVGNSMGGFVASEAAIAEPGRFEKLVLVSAAGISHARMRREPAEMAGRFAVATSPLVLRVQERGLLRPRIRYWAFRMIFHRPQWIRPELLWEFFTGGAGKPGFLPALTTLVGYDILDRLEEVDVPTLIVWGRNDRLVPAVDAEGYARRLRNARTVIFDETGHVPMAERPVRFNRLLERFLSE
jgi:pimeloyl-ACP methyl ester carboxylesterase